MVYKCVNSLLDMKEEAGDVASKSTLLIITTVYVLKSRAVPYDFIYSSATIPTIDLYSSHLLINWISIPTKDAPDKAPHICTHIIHTPNSFLSMWKSINI